MLLPREQEIELALSAAPADVASAAAVYVYTAAGYEQVRDGSNGFTCLVNRDSELDGYHVLKPTCWDAHGSTTIVPAILEIARQRASGRTVQQVTSSIRGQISDGTLKQFSRAGVAYMLAGDVSEYDETTGMVTARAFPPHIMIYAPGVTPTDLGISPAAAMADSRAPLIYESATGYRYIIVRVP